MNKISIAATLGCLSLVAGFAEEQRSSSQVVSQPEITPLAGPVIPTWAQLYASADFIYWRAAQDSLSYAGNTATDSGSVTRKGSIRELDFSYEPGFKVGLGVDFRHDGWDLGLNYTWFQEDDVKGAAHANAEMGPLVSYMVIDGSFVPSSFATGSWGLHFNALDWDLGRNFYVSPKLALRPYMGLKGAWMTQRYDVVCDALGLPIVDAIAQKESFWGVGLRGGCSGEWHFTRNWCFYGNLGLDALCSHFNTTHKKTRSASGSIAVVSYQGDRFYTVRPVLELDLGLRYQTFFSHDRYELFVQAGWANQVWWDMNQLIVALDTQGGPLVLQGLDAKFGFSF